MLNNFDVASDFIFQNIIIVFVKSQVYTPEISRFFILYEKIKMINIINKGYSKM